MQHKAIIGLFKAQDSKGGVTIEGWANKAVVDRGGDIINKDAWNVDNFKKNAIILFNHDKNQPIGKAIAVEPREEGLYIKAKISGSADPGISKVRDLIKEGVLNAFSVGFDSTNETKSADGYNEIKAAELFEVSVVSIPMNQDSLFSTTKLYDIDSVRTKAVEAYEAENGPSSKASKDAEAPSDGATEEIKEEEKSSDGKDQAEPSTEAGDDEQKDIDTTGKDIEPTDRKELDLRIQSIKVPKTAFGSLEAAAQFVASGGYSTEWGKEEGEFYVFTQAPMEQFQATAELIVDEDLGITAIIGSTALEMPEIELEKPEEKEAETIDQKDLEEFEAEKAATETNQSGPRNRVDNQELWDKAKRASRMALGKVDMAFVLWWYLRHGGTKEYSTKEAPTIPLPPPPPTGSDNLTLQAAQQSNILLGQLVAETQAVRQAIVELGQQIAMIPKQAPVEVPATAPVQVVSPLGQASIESPVAKHLEIVRQSLEMTRSKIELLERRDAL